MEYFKRDIAGKLGEPIRTVQYWTDQGIVVPDISPPRGKGKSRVYSERNLLEFKMIKAMRLRGIPLWVIKEILDRLRKGKFATGQSFDFYGDKGWGMQKEIVFTMSGSLGTFHGPTAFFPVYRGKDGRFDPKPLSLMMERDLILLVVMLGEMKVYAEKLTG